MASARTKAALAAAKARGVVLSADRMERIRVEGKCRQRHRP